MSDSWMSDYERVEAQGREIMAKINDRNKLDTNSSQYVRVQGQIRSLMHQYGGEVSRLRQSVIRASSQYHIGQREAENRQRMLDALSSKERQYNDAYNKVSSSNPFHGGGASGNPFMDDDDPPLEDLSGMGFDDIRQRQQQIIREQDTGLESLSKVIARQKAMAVDIGSEVDRQNELIDDITDHVDRTDQRVIQETQHIRLIDRKSTTCGFWVVIILLMIAIIVIAVVPFK